MREAVRCLKAVRLSSVLWLVLGLLGSSSAVLPGSPGSVSAATQATSQATPQGKTVPQGDLIDINTATPDQLKTLPGIGEAYARRIVAGRPYTAKNQLVSRGVIPLSAYNNISPRIVARRAK